MAAKHTPGPYAVIPADHLGDPAYAIQAADGDLIAVGCLRADAVLFAAAPAMLEALKKIANESVFNQQRFAEDSDTDYFLRCLKAVKDVARSALNQAQGEG